MPVYVDPDGNRYWFDGDPDWTVVRNDLVLEEEPAEEGN
jgi:hypothetical protein